MDTYFSLNSIRVTVFFYFLFFVHDVRSRQKLGGESVTRIGFNEINLVNIGASWMQNLSIQE